MPHTRCNATMRITLALLVLSAFLAGCATVPGENRTANTGTADTIPSSVSGMIEQARRNGETMAHTSYIAPARRDHYSPQQWPSPDIDLWSKVRAGFQLPPYNDRLLVRIWTQYYATHTKHLYSSLRRARPWLWQVVHKIEQRHMPTELALLPIVESGYNPMARSSSGASGMWQFMPATGKDMGLEQNWWYDGRNDPTASTTGALDYLEWLAERYNGNWVLAMAAYNAGPGTVDDAIARARAEGRPTDFWNLELPTETQQYVPQIFALRRILETPARFGIVWPKQVNRKRTQLVSLPSRISIKKAADMLNMSTAELDNLNPGLRRAATGPNRHKLHVPAAKAATFRYAVANADPDSLFDSHVHTVRRGDTLSRIARANDVSVAALRRTNSLRSNRIRVGQKLVIPGSGGTVAPAPASSTRTYIVRSGDTLWHIASTHNISVASLKHLNGAATNTLYPGQQLTIPGNATVPAHASSTTTTTVTSSTTRPSRVVVHPGDTLWSIAQDHNISVAQLRRLNKLAPGTPLIAGTTLSLNGSTGSSSFYKVKPGDTLWSIASQFSMRVNTLQNMNGLGANTSIQPGDRLRVRPVSG